MTTTSPYRFIAVSAIPQPIDAILDEKSPTSVGIIEETKLALLAPELLRALRLAATGGSAHAVFALQHLGYHINDPLPLSLQDDVELVASYAESFLDHWEEDDGMNDSEAAEAAAARASYAASVARLRAALAPVNAPAVGTTITVDGHTYKARRVEQVNAYGRTGYRVYYDVDGKRVYSPMSLTAWNALV